MRRYFMFGLFLFLATGCVTIQTVSIEVLKPAQVAISPNYRNLVLMNSAYTDSNPGFSYPMQNALFQFDTLVSQGVLFKLQTLLTDSPRFDSVFSYNRFVERRPTQILKPLPMSVVTTHAKPFQADAVLSLEAMSLHDSILEFSYELETGTLTQKYFMVLASTLWRIYDADSGQQVFQLARVDTLFFNAFETKKQYYSTLESDYSRQNYANEAANAMAYSISDYIAPFWHSESRTMLVTESDSIVEGARLAFKSEWWAAAAYWQPLTTSPTKRVAAVACHNMALACEVAGKSELALTWIQKAMAIKSFQVSNHYYEILKQRFDESHKLDQQFGIKP